MIKPDVTKFIFFDKDNQMYLNSVDYKNYHIQFYLNNRSMERLYVIFEKDIIKDEDYLECIFDTNRIYIPLNEIIKENIMSKIKSHSLSRNVKKVYRVSMKENPKGIHIKPKETFDKIIDQKGRLYLLEGCLVFPLFYYYGDGCLDSHNQVPRLHTRVGCKSTN